MSKTMKAVLLALCAILLVVASVAGTVAYLQMKTAPVVNTFTVGKVEIELKETAMDPETGLAKTGEADVTAVQNIKLVPGREIAKNPKIFVKTGSEKCYLFVKVENALADAGVINWDPAKWIPVEGNYYRYFETVDASKATEDVKVDVFTAFTCNNDLTKEQMVALNGKNITITAYAIQAEKLTADTAFAAIEK